MSRSQSSSHPLTLVAIAVAVIVILVIAGYVVFSEIPDLWTIAGSAVIVVSALYTSHRERVQANTPSSGGNDRERTPT